MKNYIGIDIGATTSYIGYMDKNSQVQILPGENIVYSYTPLVRKLVGSFSASQTVTVKDRMENAKIVSDVKNHVGHNLYKVEVDGEKVRADLIYTLILSHLINNAKDKLGSIDGAVITVPSFCSKDELTTIKYAAKFAGLEDIVMIDETAAAAVFHSYSCNYYGHSFNKYNNKNVLVYDLGSGSFKCAVVKLDVDGKKYTAETIDANGDRHFGADKWNEELKKCIVNKFCSARGLSFDEVMKKNENEDFFITIAESVKKRINRNADIPYGLNKGNMYVSPEEFEKATEELLTYTIDIVDRMLCLNKFSVMRDIDEIILAGGGSSMLQVKKRLLSEYGLPVSCNNPDRITALGAALVANGQAEVK